MSAAEDASRLWLAKADNNLLNIENNLAAELIPWDTVCFHAQQVGEKTLKAFLVLNGEQPPRTHDLVALLAKANSYAPGLADLEDDCRRLTYFSVSSRYPDPYEPTEEEGRSPAAAAKRVRTRVVGASDSGN